mmetsp:Transcript_39652/g.68418  ORF Transcript_39652/g.68418 Transcript_39652/m.68418 type:complete len:326 (+) Transcript_39652:1010-1987(+)
MGYHCLWNRPAFHGSIPAAGVSAQHLLHHGPPLLAHQRHGPAAGPRARRAPHPVDVRRPGAWDVVVDHGLDPDDVEAAGGHVGAQEDVRLPVLELLEGVQPLGLGQVPVHLHRVQPQKPQNDGKSVHVRLGVEEHDDLPPEGAGEQRRHDGLAVVLLGLLDADELLHQAAGHLAGVVHLDPHRLVQAQGHQLLHLHAHSGGEEQGLAARGAGAGADDLLHLVLEAQLHQPVHLVQNQDLDVVQVEPAAVGQVVHQPARGGHHHVRPPAQLRLLRPQVLGPADHQRALGVCVLAQRLQHAEALRGQLARRGHHQHPRRAHLARAVK